MIAFTVAGIPQQKGSKKAYVRGGRAVIVDMNRKYKAWQDAVANAARVAMCGDPPLDGPVVVAIEFYLPRPKHVPKSRKGWPCVMPDEDKLVRTVRDGMSGIVYHDDGQVCCPGRSLKDYERDGIPPGAVIVVAQLGCRHYSGPMRNGKCRDCGEEL